MEIFENKHFVHSLTSQDDLASNSEKSEQTNTNDINSMVDFWYYDIGVNVIPAKTKEKKTFENWSNWQDNPIPVEIHDAYKKAGYYKDGIAIIAGKIWRGPFEGKYLIAIDLDNKKAIEEFVGSATGFEELKQIALVEQHSDLTKIHIYFIVDREIPNKASDKTNTDTPANKIDSNEIPALEVKSNGKGIMFCSPSRHRNGSNYQIIGTLKPQVFSANEVEQRISLICEKYNIFYGSSRRKNNNESKIPLADLFKSETRILQGHNRHEALLRVMESLLQRNRGIMTLEEIKENTQKINQRLCVPPLDDMEFERQWQCALKFVGRSFNNNTAPAGHSGYFNDNIKDNNIQSSNNTNDSKSIADILVKLTLENSTLFKDDFGIPHGLVKINNDHFEVLSIEGSKFESYLSKLYYDNYGKKTANAEAINNSKRTLGAKAIFDCRTISLHLRVAWANPENKESIYYDMTDEKRRCIKIKKGNGWKVVDNQLEVLYKRYGHESPQVEPLHDYDIKVFHKFINSLNIKNEKHKLLVKIWIVSLFIPDIPIPMLLPFGAEGSAKSTLQKKIKLLIDPSKLKPLSIYNDKTQFIQQLSHNFLCFYDNVRNEPRWLSDEVCRAITGAAFTKRKNYSDDEDIPYEYKKIISFSGINVIFKQADVLDRSIKIELERVDPKKKIPEERIESELKQEIPHLLGYIFEVLVKALEIKDSVNLSELPRMADFAEWGEAIARAMGYNPLEFLTVYFENIGEQKIEIVEADPFADAISKFIDYDATSWISSLQTFIKYLNEYAEKNNIDNSKFPMASQAISNRLRKVKANLLEGLGIEVIVERITSGKGNKKLMNTAIVKIKKRSPVSPVAPVSESEEGESSTLTGDVLDTKDMISREIMRSPVNYNQFCAQISCETTNTGDLGGTGDHFNKRRSVYDEENLIPCHYCKFTSNNESEVLTHSINVHPGKPARPETSLLELMKETEAKSTE